MNNITTMCKRDDDEPSVLASKLKKTWDSMVKARFLLLLVLPGLIFYVIFNYLPMYGVLIAFQDFSIGKGIWGSEWVGFEQFVKFFNHLHFWRLLKNTLVLSVLQLIIVFPIQVIFAVLLNEIAGKRYKRFVQTVSYLPHFISLPAIIGIFVMFLSPTDGTVNMFLQKILGMETINFMAEPAWFRPLYIFSEIWQQMGWGAIVFLVAITNINPELFEAATIDGSSRMKMIWHITLPSMLDTVVVMFLLQIGRIMSLAPDKALLMQSPITYQVSDIISTFVYRMGLEQAQYSFSAAVDLFNSAINIVILCTCNWLIKRATDSSLF